jgi:hypothetical protein
MTAALLLAVLAAWRPVAGGEGTGCAHGARYDFFVRMADPRKLLVYFQGGGACWSEATCVRRTFDPSVEAADDPTQGRGILDDRRADNPFAGWSAVYAPYCTADAFLGARAASYPGATVDHRGAANAQAVLDWVARHVRAPSVVVVAGGSAGAIASPLHAAALAERYPRARVVQIGDGAGGYRTPAIAGVLAAWGAPAAPSFEALYVRAAGRAPRATFTQVNQSQDAIQRAFLRLLGEDDRDFAARLGANLAEIRAAHAGFRAFVLPGSDHTVLTSPEFYTLSADGTALRDWVAGLAEGRAVGDVGLAALR